jgi:hypothetical protein
MTDWTQSPADSRTHRPRPDNLHTERHRFLNALWSCVIKQALMSHFLRTLFAVLSIANGARRSFERIELSQTDTSAEE